MKAILSTLATCAFLTTAAAQAGEFSVAFINPGGSTDFWGEVAGTMRAAANDLDIDLEVIDTSRDRFAMAKAAQDIASRTGKPDVVVIVNELQQGPELLATLDKAGIKTFFLLNKLTDEQEAKAGKARQGVPNLIGSLIPDNEIAGYEMGRSLIVAARKAGKDKDGISILALIGDTATPAALQREAGLKRAVKEDPAAKIVRAIPVHWNRDTAKDRASAFLARETADAIWAANDPIAFGAMEAAREKGLKPGVDISFAGLNWSADALKAVKAGEMTLTHGGHFFGGAWSMVLLYDYMKGADFASGGGADVQFPMSAVTGENVDAFLAKLGAGDWERIDFASFSKAKAGVANYTFSADAILAAAGD
ncbi:MAG: ABC transporter substrate-binding protein [Pseudochelatococcus sp.]|uniref:ABC transporter substrate-binding protein n=1 Tax=Pseudochelatococcus sp. TaxID=2020869 RepID=UPI003D90C6C6